MEPINAKDIARAVIDALAERSHIDQETHRLHHDWIERQIEAASNQAARIEAVKRQVLGWLSIGTIGLVGAMVLRWLRGDGPP